MTQQAPEGNRRVFQTERGVFSSHDKDDVLGKGTYGVVYRAHLKSDPSVKKAIKIFSPDTMDEAEGIPSTTLREINALKTIDHPNVMSAEEVVIPDGRSPTDMFFVMELCKGTLKDKAVELIKKYLNSDPSWLSPSPDARLPEGYVREVKILAWELLNSLAVVHSRGIMHRDLKPVNILWSFDDLLKLADFGLARFVRGNQNAANNVIPQTGEVQTMWYRAPEVLLGDDKYGLLVDDWSLGCVIAELFRFRKSSSGRLEPSPLFQGRSDVGTLMLILETLGTPQVDAGNKSDEYLFRFPHWTTSTLRERVPLLDNDGYDLVQQLLRISPSERKAARFLLDHCWFSDIRPQLTRFVRWYTGFEEDYKRMMLVDRLPLPRALREAKDKGPIDSQEQQKQHQRAHSRDQRSNGAAAVEDQNKLEKPPTPPDKATAIVNDPIKYSKFNTSKKCINASTVSSKTGVNRPGDKQQHVSNNLSHHPHFHSISTDRGHPTAPESRAVSTFHLSCIKATAPSERTCRSTSPLEVDSRRVTDHSKRLLENASKQTTSSLIPPTITAGNRRHVDTAAPDNAVMGSSQQQQQKQPAADPVYPHPSRAVNRAKKPPSRGRAKTTVAPPLTRCPPPMWSAMARSRSPERGAARGKLRNTSTSSQLLSPRQQQLPIVMSRGESDTTGATDIKHTEQEGRHTKRNMNVVDLQRLRPRVRSATTGLLTRAGAAAIVSDKNAGA